MLTRPCKLQDPVKVQKIVDAYFSEREEQQEVRELKTVINVSIVLLQVYMLYQKSSVSPVMRSMIIPAVRMTRMKHITKR